LTARGARSAGAPMDWLFVLVFACVAAAMVVAALGISRLFAPHRPGGTKNEPYECGERTIGPTWVQFNVGYYLFALLFLVFDVEAAFLYPWAVVVREFGLTGLVEIGVFGAVLLVALAYAWRKGALRWV